MKHATIIKRALVGALTLAMGLSLSPVARADTEFTFTDTDVLECIYDDNVWVLVDPGAGELLGGCATEFATGSAALA
ncbi:hypothetical protein ACX1DX_07375 [Tessaracoccus sp. Y36]